MTQSKPSNERPGDKPIRSLPVQAEQRLREWFESKLGESLELTHFGRPADGFSGDTFVVRLVDRGARERRYIVRSEVRQNVMIPLRDFSMLHRVQKILHGVAMVPVPAVLFVENDERILGSAFYVSEFIDGLAPGDSPPYTHLGWVAESSTEQVRAMWFRGIETLAKLHTLDWEALGLGFVRRRSGQQSELEADYDYFVQCCDWAYGGRWSFINEVVAWLRAHWPAQERLKFSWGDARLGNMLWREHRPVAVLDWDWVTICDPERDLGYWLFNHRYFFEYLQGKPLAWPTREETLRHYEQCSGFAVRNPEFYEGYACFRQLALMIRVASLMKAAGNAPYEDFVENNPVVTAMRNIMTAMP